MIQQASFLPILLGFVVLAYRMEALTGTTSKALKHLVDLPEESVYVVGFNDGSGAILDYQFG